MKAKLLPITDKYYGTIIELDFEDGTGKETMVLWCTNDENNYKIVPSIRELEIHSFDEKQWIDNELVEWDGEMIPIRATDIVVDCHFEDKVTYEKALKIIDLLNKS